MNDPIDPAIVEKALNATGWVQENREYLRGDLTRALEAATPLIAAQALREAAEAFGETQMIREGDVKEWLRARAEHAARCPHPKCSGGSLCCCADALEARQS